MENKFEIDPSLLFDGTEKVGDTIWTLGEGLTTIKKIEDLTSYPIRTAESNYTLEGKTYSEDKYPSAFKRNPFVSLYPKLMEVSDDKQDGWQVRLIYAKVNNVYWGVNGAKDEYRPIVWLYAREIQPKAPEFSEEQKVFKREI